MRVSADLPVKYILELLLGNRETVNLIVNAEVAVLSCNKGGTARKPRPFWGRFFSMEKTADWELTMEKENENGYSTRFGAKRTSKSDN